MNRVNDAGRTTVLATVILAAIALAGCADQASRAGEDPSSPTPTITEQCALTDISAIRADTGNRVTVAAAPARVKAAVVSQDNQSFIATVTPKELIAAGITPPQSATADTPVTMVVNHGDWSTDDLPISVAGGGQPAGSTDTPPQPAASRIAWIITLFPGATGDPTDVTYAPDNACFKS